MPIVFGVADVHVGNHGRHGGPLVGGMNTRCRQVLQSVREAVAEVVKFYGVLVIAGDLLDVVRPEAPILRALQEALEPATTIILKGNHDSNSAELGDHALGPLAPVATIVESPQVFMLNDDFPLNVWCVPFQPGPAKDWLPGVMAELAKEPTLDAPNLLALHLGIQDANTPKFLQNSDDSITATQLAALCQQYGIDHVFAGNWHNRKYWEFDKPFVGIQQIGALVPTGWDNPGLKGYGGLAMFDPSKVGERHSVYEIKGPRFVKVRGGIEDANAVIKKATWKDLVYLQVTTHPDDVAAVTDHLAKVRKTGRLAMAEVRPESIYREAKAATAAHNARNAASVEEAVSSYVRNMPLAEGSFTAAQAVEEKAFRERLIQGARELLVSARSAK